MKAAICTKYGPPEVVKIEERPKPLPKNNEILIRVHTTTITAADYRVRGAQFPSFYKLIFPLLVGVGKPRKSILGLNLSGQIEEVGKKVTKFKKGDWVFGTTGIFSSGAHAEYVTLPENAALTIKPNTVSHEEAVAIIFGGNTALVFLRKAHIQKGQKVLIYGASGSVGTAAVQLAKYFGAEVTGVCSGANMELVKSLGADKVIDYTAEDFRNKDERYDVIFDAVGKITRSSCKKVLAKNGKYLDVMKGFAAANTENLRFLVELTKNGKHKAVIDKIYPLERIVEAYTYADTGRKKGNIVIKIAE